MKGYFSVISARFRMLLQYRAAAAGAIGTRLFWGLIRMMIFEGFYRSTPAAQPMSYGDVVTYVWLGQGVLALTLWRVDPDIRAMVRNGIVAYELLRPLDLYSLWYSRALAAVSAPTLLQATPVCVAAWLFLGMKPPPTVLSGLAWLVTLAGSVLLSCAIATVINISVLWTVSGEGVSRLMPALAYTLSGMLVPIPLCPPWAQAVLEFLPFRGLVDAPFRVYLGQIPPAGALGVVLHQVAWTLAFVVLGRWMLARAARQMVVQGG